LITYNHNNNVIIASLSELFFHDYIYYYITFHSYYDLL
jgi:hypothetical protein